MMGGQWLEVLRGLPTPKKQENGVLNGLRERASNEMQGYAIKEYQSGLTAVKLVKTFQSSQCPAETLALVGLGQNHTFTRSNHQNKKAAGQESAVSGTRSL